MKKLAEESIYEHPVHSLILDSNESDSTEHHNCPIFLMILSACCNGKITLKENKVKLALRNKIVVYLIRLKQNKYLWLTNENVKVITEVENKNR